VTEVVWFVAVLGSLVGMTAGAIAGAALCVDCELEALFWVIAGSVVGGTVAGVAAGLVARRFARPRRRRVWWVVLLMSAAALLAVTFQSLFGVEFGGDVAWMVVVAAVFVLPIVVGILAAMGVRRFDRSEGSRPNAGGAVT
jgi:hypothetical protein